MKIFLASLILIAIMFSCSSDSDKNGNGVNGVGTADCPIFEGAYLRKAAETEFTINLMTKREGAFPLYSFNEGVDFLRADGSVSELKLEGKNGTIRVNCDPTSVTVTAVEEDEDAVVTKYTIAGDFKVKLESNGPTAATLNGIYSRKEK